MKVINNKIALALSLVGLSSISLAAPYEVVDLGGLDGDRSVAYDINEAGLSVGYASGPLDEDNNRTFFAHAVQYDDAGNIDLGTLPDGTSSEAVGINDALVSVGFGNEVSEVDEQTIVEQFPLVYEGGTVSKLPELEGLTQGIAYDINNSGYVILGGFFDEDPEDEFGTPDRAFVFDRNTDSFTMIQPFAVGPERRSYVTAINDNGDVVGFSDIEDGEDTFRIAAYITNVNDLSTLTEIPTIDNTAIFARSVNATKEVVGNMYIPGTRDLREAFYVDMSAANPVVETLGFLGPDFMDSRANDINNMGQIVGRALISVPTLGESGAFLYENDEMKNLNDLIPCDSEWRLTEARSINDSGQIVGIGVLDGEVRAFRLDPTGDAVEQCQPDNQNSGGGSFPVLLLSLLGVLALRRELVR